jgi:hypothetical protein
MMDLGMYYSSVIGRTSNKEYKVDEYGFKLVNFTHLIYTGESIIEIIFVLSTQVSQIYYVANEINLNWVVVAMTKPRDMFDVGKGEGNDDDVGDYRDNEPFNLMMLPMIMWSGLEMIYSGPKYKFRVGR